MYIFPQRSSCYDTIVFLMYYHTTTHDSGTEMQSVTIANTGSSTTWTNGSPSYSLSFNGSALTACLAHDAEDWELEVL